jgi:hypothetical protein
MGVHDSAWHEGESRPLVDVTKERGLVAGRLALPP